MGLKELCVSTNYHQILESYIIYLQLLLFIYILNVITLASQVSCKHSILTHQIGNEQKA